MNSYIFITTEGYTFRPESESTEPDIENCQVIGFAQGTDERSAFENLVAENGYLIGTTFDQIRCFELRHTPPDDFAHYFYLTDWKTPPAVDLPQPYRNHITQLTESEKDVIVDEGKTCHYCSEPFKECDRVVPGLGVLVGATDVVKFLGKYWHYGCIADWYKENAGPNQLRTFRG
jgi:hypothetical protein